MAVIGIASPERMVPDGHPDADTRTTALTERGITQVVTSAFDLERELSVATPPDTAVAPALPRFSEAQAAF